MTEKIFNATLPPVPRDSDRQVRQFNAAVKQALEELRNNVVLSKDGIVSRRNSNASRDDVGSGSLTLPPTTSGTPAAPVNLQANGAIENIVLSWDYSGNKVEYFEIWRADSDSFGLATLRAITQGTVYADTIGAGNSKYYWVRGVADGEVFGPFNAVSGVLGQTARDPVDVLAEVSEGIKQSALAQSLLDGIPDLAGLPDEILARVQGDADEAAARQAAIAAVETDVQTVASDLEAETQTRTSQISSLNNSVSAFQSTVDTVASDLEAETQARTTAISQLGDDFAAADVSLQTQINNLGDLSSEYTVKLDVNGKISGFGLFNDGQTSDFQVLSDRFAIVNENNSGDIITPFVVSNGEVVMDNAYIVDLTATNISAGSITADEIQSGTITADKIQAGTITADELDANSVTSDKIAANSVTAGKIVLDNATIVGDGNAIKIKNLGVDTLQIADNAVTVPDAVSADNAVSIFTPTTNYYYAVLDLAVSSIAGTPNLITFSIHAFTNAKEKFGAGLAVEAPGQTTQILYNAGNFSGADSTSEILPNTTIAGSVVHTPPTTTTYTYRAFLFHQDSGRLLKATARSISRLTVKK